MIKISIIIPTFNSAKTISSALESILQQSFSDFEILIMDGISTDNTLVIAESYSDERIKIFSEKDLGIYDAMNKGIKLAQGEWLYFLGSDDRLINSELFSEIMPNLTSDKDLVYGNVLWGNTGKKFDGPFDLEKLIKYRNICQQAIFYKRNLFLKIGLFKNEFKYCADHYFNIQCFIACKNIIYVDKTIAIYNNEGKSSLFNDDLFQKTRTLLLIEMYENPLEVYKKYLKHDQLVNFYKNSKDYRLGHFLLSPFRFILKNIFKLVRS
ncbi:MAG: glycosyltransferase family 2 protein [Bacteroidetes bacterium]|nr:glycosyltransferase family 2 protein [Bacteroidota bacterium]